MVRAGKNEKEIISALGISVNDYRGSRQRIKRKKD
jgi:DNA-binding CsgD family transcriptional regulator